MVSDPDVMIPTLGVVFKGKCQFGNRSLRPGASLTVRNRQLKAGRLPHLAMSGKGLTGARLK